MSNLIHGQNLATKLKKEKDSENRRLLNEIKARYDEWQKENMTLKDISRKGVEDRVSLLNGYMDFINEPRFRKEKGNKQGFTSQSQLHSSVLEEFMYYLFKDIPVLQGKQLNFGRTQAYTNLYFAPRNPKAFENDPNLTVHVVKDQDFAISKALHIGCRNADGRTQNGETAMSRETLKADGFQEYPDAKLARRERKVKGRSEKERARGGSKFKNQAHASEAAHPALSAFIDKIIPADACEILQRLPDSSIDIVLTSPPYNFGLEYADDRHQDAIHWQEYFARLKNVWSECLRVLKPGGRLIVNVQPLFSDYIPTHHVISCQLQELGMLWKGEILWEKNNYNCKYTAWGSWKSPSMPYLKYTWEFVEVFCKATHKKAGRPEDIDISAEEFKEWVYAKWSIAPERNMKELGHPAVFPEKLVERLLKLFSYRGDIVLDPFNGVGTTTCVAARLGRHYIGIDLSEQYCATANARIDAARRQAKLF